MKNTVNNDKIEDWSISLYEAFFCCVLNSNQNVNTDDVSCCNSTHESLREELQKNEFENRKKSIEEILLISIENYKKVEIEKMNPNWKSLIYKLFPPTVQIGDETIECDPPKIKQPNIPSNQQERHKQLLIEVESATKSIKQYVDRYKREFLKCLKSGSIVAFGLKATKEELASFYKSYKEYLEYGSLRYIETKDKKGTKLISVNLRLNSFKDPFQEKKQKKIDTVFWEKANLNLYKNSAFLGENGFIRIYVNTREMKFDFFSIIKKEILENGKKTEKQIVSERMTLNAKKSRNNNMHTKIHLEETIISIIKEHPNCSEQIVWNYLSKYSKKIIIREVDNGTTEELSYIENKNEITLKRKSFNPYFKKAKKFSS